MYKFVLLVGMFFVSLFSMAQQRMNTDNTNTWFVYNGDHKFSNKWGVHIETQIRCNNLINNWQQLLLRTGINYHFNSNIFATIGYCYVETFPYGAFPVKLKFPENRLWEQLQIKNQISKIEWVSRFRLEQRLTNLPILNTTTNFYILDDATYTNRFRLFNRISVPFKGKTISNHSFYITAYDEFFINFGKQVAVNLFDQNRAYLALGYKIPQLGRLELGYLEQTLVKGDGLKIENNHTFQISLNSNFDFIKAK